MIEIEDKDILTNEKDQQKKLDEAALENQAAAGDGAE